MSKEPAGAAKVLRFDHLCSFRVAVATENNTALRDISALIEHFLQFNYHGLLNFNDLGYGKLASRNPGLPEKKSVTLLFNKALNR
jgi:hypothetical protein